MAWSAIILAAGLAASSPGGHPLTLEVSQAQGQVVIKLVGEAQAAWTGTYELEVTGGRAGSSNRSVQKGTARVEAGKVVTIATLRLANAEGASWSAWLHVVPAAGLPYDLRWRGS